MYVNQNRRASTTIEDKKSFRNSSTDKCMLDQCMHELSYVNIRFTGESHYQYSTMYYYYLIDQSMGSDRAVIMYTL